MYKYLNSPITYIDVLRIFGPTIMQLFYFLTRGKLFTRVSEVLTFNQLVILGQNSALLAV